MTQARSGAAEGDAGGESAAVARQICPDQVGDGVERPITVDQTNRSVVVDDTVIVKWLRPPQRRPHHGSDVLAHLDEVGFDAMPAFHGTRVVDDHVVASATAFVRGATDGWVWYLDEVQAWVDGSLPTEVLERRATALGALAGRLHCALATPSTRWPHPVTQIDVHTLHARAVALLHDVLAPAGGERPEQTDRLARLARRSDRIGAAIERLAGHGAAPAIAIHGDLHVGNVLATGERLFVIDFDGDPIADDRIGRRQPAAVDVAALLQSIDHVGRIVDHRTDRARHIAVTAFIDDSIERALAAYREELAAAALGHLLDDDLLGPLRVVQELHELAYAAAHLPHWVHVPDAALAAMFPDELDD